MSHAHERWLLWRDTARTPADNMAVDETLLRAAGTLSGPLIRAYAWAQPAVSIGYFQPAALHRRPGTPVVRRPSGGGQVEHGDDLTFSMIIPTTSALFAVDRFESYRLINDVVRQALAALDVPCRLHAAEIPAGVDRERMACFQTANRFDVVLDDGRKICGGAQCRRRYGMLHQGSISLGAWSALRRGRTEGALAEAFTEFFGRPAQVFEPAPELLQAAAGLAAERYATRAWTERR